jgi:hypothetical protein
MTGIKKITYSEWPSFLKRRDVVFGIASLMPFSLLGKFNPAVLTESSLFTELNYIDNASKSKSTEAALADIVRWLSVLCREASHERLKDILYGRIMSDYMEDRLVLRGNKFISLTENYLYEVLRLKHGS